ncbi:hypothetical protein HSX11_02990 [Oxalobacteraceae bacterium]|nr:hypothetical protein [Oxalobacteraceae bacterium]
MATHLTESKINTEQPVRNDGAKRLPHERDEAPDAQHPQPRKVMKQAASDIERGLVDTDLHGQRGVEQTQSGPKGQQQADPQPGSKRD